MVPGQGEGLASPQISWFYSTLVSCCIIYSLFLCSEKVCASRCANFGHFVINWMCAENCRASEVKKKKKSLLDQLETMLTKCGSHRTALLWTWHGLLENSARLYIKLANSIWSSSNELISPPSFGFLLYSLFQAFFPPSSFPPCPYSPLPLSQPGVCIVPVSALCGNRSSVCWSIGPIQPGPFQKDQHHKSKRKTTPLCCRSTFSYPSLPSLPLTETL